MQVPENVCCPAQLVFGCPAAPYGVVVAGRPNHVRPENSSFEEPIVFSTVSIASGTANGLRRKAQRAAQLPEDLPQGWSISPVSPQRVLEVFGTLRIKPQFALQAYCYRSGHDGNGVVYAMPAQTPPLPPAQCQDVGDYFFMPRPPEALEHVMDAIEGDGSPLSYMSASLLYRELCEFGALWHGVTWGACQLLGRAPAQAGYNRSRQRAVSNAQSSQWTWRHRDREKFPPRVTHTEHGVEVRLHVFNPIGVERIYRETDVFPFGRYTFTTTTLDLAEGSRGRVF